MSLNIWWWTAAKTSVSRDTNRSTSPRFSLNKSEKMAQALCEIRSLRFYRWSLLPSIFFQLRLIREGNSQTAWIIKKHEMEPYHVTLQTAGTPDFSHMGLLEKKKLYIHVSEQGFLKHVIGPNLGLSFLLLLHTVGEMWGWGKTIIPGWLFTSGNFKILPHWKDTLFKCWIYKIIRTHLKEKIKLYH